MPNVLHVGQFCVHLNELGPTSDRVNDMRRNSKRIGQLVDTLNARIHEETPEDASCPSVTWREVVGVDSFIYGELYAYDEGAPEQACVSAITAVRTVCAELQHHVKFEQLHKF